jgi:hypothetical protein
MFDPGSILGSTFFASREPVRNPLALKLVHVAQALGSKEPSLMGSIGHRLVRGFLLSADAILCNMKEGEIVEVTDYDPVRKTSIVIGMRGPSRFLPLHWLALQTHPDKLVTLYLAVESPPPGVSVFGSKLLHGSFEEAMEVVRSLKASGKGSIFIDGAGLFMVTRDLETLSKDFEALLEAARAEVKKTPTKKKKNKK